MLQQLQNGYFGPILLNFDQKQPKWSVCECYSIEYFCKVQLVKVIGRSLTSFLMTQIGAEKMRFPCLADFDSVSTESDVINVVKMPGSAPSMT